ncbi:MAG: acetylxylan esterase [Paludibacteraceae bacterium]
MGLSDKQLFEVLSYSDIKNLTANIKYSIITVVGLQDEVCPPYTIFRDIIVSVLKSNTIFFIITVTTYQQNGGKSEQHFLTNT